MMVTLGAEACAQIFKSLDEEDVEILTAEIARLEGITPEMREKVLEEFHQMAVAQKYILQGGVDYARQALEAAMGPRRAKEILEKVQSSIRTTGFSLLQDVDPSQLVNFIQKEHPQTIALLLAHMDASMSAPILSALPQELQVDVTTRLATMQIGFSRRALPGRRGAGHPDEEPVRRQRFRSGRREVRGRDAQPGRSRRGKEHPGQPGAGESGTGHRDQEPDVRLRGHHAPGRQAASSACSRKWIPRNWPWPSRAPAIPWAEKFFKNMSSRASEMMKEDMAFMGPVRVKDVEGAQQRIVDIVRRLEDDGEIIISGRGGDDEDRGVSR